MNVAHAPLCVGQMTAGERGNETTQSGHNKKKRKTTTTTTTTTTMPAHSKGF
jgi:hypothetical protein